MQKSGKRGGIIVIAALSILIITICILKWDKIADAVFNRDEAVHINPDEIENSTLIIGTHLIHLSAYNDEIREKAEKSEGESGQYKRYYKSELADGVWYDITDATNLADISTGGKPVTNDEIRELLLLYHTKSDKITYDLRTNEPVCIYNTPEPYNLYTLAELEPLKNKYDMIMSGASHENEDDNVEFTESDAFSLSVVRTFFDRDLTWGYMHDCDEKINGLQNFYNILSTEEDKNKEMEIVMSMMKATDAGRRAEIFRRLLEDWDSMDYYMTVLYATTLWDNTPKEGFKSNSDLISGLEESISNVTTSYTENKNLMLQEGDSTKAREKYAQQMRLIESAQAGDYDTGRDAVNKLLLLDNIENNVIGDRQAELDYLQATLEPNAQTAYKNKLSAGVSEDYKAIASNTGATRAALAGLLNEQKDALNACRVELQELINAIAMRIESPEETQQFLEDKLAAMENYSNLAADDDFAAYARSTVNDLKDFMGDAVAEAIADNGGTETDLLNKQKEEYQEKLLECLDNNDLSGANKYEALVAEVDNALAQTGGAGNSLIDDLRKQIVDYVKDGDTESANIGMSAMEQLAEEYPNAVNEAMNNLIPALSDLAEMSEGVGNLGTSFDTENNDNQDNNDSDNNNDNNNDNQNTEQNTDSKPTDEQKDENNTNQEKNTSGPITDIIVVLNEALDKGKSQAIDNQPADSDATKAINVLEAKIIADIQASDAENAKSEINDLVNMAGKNPDAAKKALEDIISLAEQLAEIKESNNTTSSDNSRYDSLKDVLDDMNSILNDIDEIAKEPQNDENPDTQAAARVVEELKEQIIKDAKADNIKDIAKELDSMTDMAKKNKESAVDALEEMIPIIEELLADKKAEESDVDTSGPISELVERAGQLKENTENKDKVTQGTLEKILSDYIDTDFNSLDDKKQVIILNAVNKYVDYSKSTASKKLLRSVADKMYNGNNSYIFEKYKGDKGEFVSTVAISKCLGYRYIYNNNFKSVVLSKKGNYYTFKEYDIEAMHGNVTERMNQAAGFQSIIYVSEDYTLKAFGCYASYVTGSNYSYLLTDDIDAASEELFSRFVEIGGN